MIRKALIPIAGLGTRLGPLARAVPKSMFPLLDDQNRVRPVIQYIIDEAVAAGVEKVGLIVSPGHLDILRKYFTAQRKESHDKTDCIEFISQPAPMGFGEAVARGAHFIGDEPFMLLLGDHIYKTATTQACAAQVAQAYQVTPSAAAMIGMQAVPEDELVRVGAAAGEEAGPRLYRCRTFVEKPAVELARRSLKMASLPPGRYLAHSGIYIFTPEIMEILAMLAVQDRPMGQEIQLAEAQGILLERHPDDYYLYQIDGRAYDTGTPAGFIAAQDAMRQPIAD